MTNPATPLDNQASISALVSLIRFNAQAIAANSDNIAATNAGIRELKVASVQDFIQLRGYDGCSDRDIAAVIGIKRVSIRYRFLPKGDLGQSVTMCDLEQLAQRLVSIMVSTASARTRLGAMRLCFETCLWSVTCCACAGCLLEMWKLCRKW